MSLPLPCLLPCCCLCCAARVRQIDFQLLDTTRHSNSASTVRITHMQCNPCNMGSASFELWRVRRQNQKAAVWVRRHISVLCQTHRLMMFVLPVRYNVEKSSDVCPLPPSTPFSSPYSDEGALFIFSLCIHIARQRQNALNHRHHHRHTLCIDRIGWIHRAWPKNQMMERSDHGRLVSFFNI